MNIQNTQQHFYDYLFLQHPPFDFYLNFTILNALISLIFILIFVPLIPSRFKRYNPYIALFLFSWSFFMPLVGFLILFFGVVSIRYYARDYQEIEFLTSVHKQFGSEKLAKLSSHGAGWGYTRVFNATFSTEDRERALHAMNKQRNHQINDINRALLDDATYEIRLYAFNFLNKQQNMITNSIKDCLEFQKSITDVNQLGKLNKFLAYLYWENVLLNSSSNELTSELLKKTHEYINYAIECYPSDMHLRVLLADVYKKMNKMDEYRSTLETVSQFEYVPTAVHFKLAELNFNEGRYDEVQRHLSHLLEYNDISINASLIKFWCQYE